jgi:broad specificity phosphatase PhoE
MKYLILVKHSQPEIVETIPATEWVLSQEGKTRAYRLGERLKLFSPEVVISSSEPKAVQTARIISQSVGLPVQTMEALREHDRSNTSFLTKQEFASRIQEFFERPDELVFGSETADQAHDRFSSAVKSILHEVPDQTFLIVAHGTVISLFVARLTGVSAFSLWAELGLPSFVVVDMRSNLIVAKENIP